jgi:hypothetical protein
VQVKKGSRPRTRNVARATADDQRAAQRAVNLTLGQMAKWVAVRLHAALRGGRGERAVQRARER